MKIGIISDVHSNIDALKEVFKRFNDEKVDKVICIGDVIGIGPYSEKCIQFLMNNKNMLLSFVKGNHENYLLNGIPKKNHNEENAKPMTEEQIATHVWNHSRLNSEQIEFIRNLQDKDFLEIEGKKILIEHYPMDENSKFKRFIKNSSREEINELFKEKQADVYLFGHTHQKYYLEDNCKYYINPGSLGCPINAKGASAGILEIYDDKIEYRQLEIEYDIEKVINEIEQLDYPLCDFMINKFYKNGKKCKNSSKNS